MGNTRPRVDLLLRKSAVVRDGEYSLSLRAQERRGREWADREGYQVREIWRENLSAWSDIERPKYDAAMRAVTRGEVDALWVYALDRFSRKGAESVIPVLGKARVVFDYERLDSSVERDRRWIIDRAENAREFSHRLSYNIKSTKSAQREEGRWLSAPPYGFEVEPSTKKLRPGPQWGVVQRIYRQAAEGVSSRSIARDLNRRGIPSPGGSEWRAGGVSRIVSHPVYEGWLTVSPKGRRMERYLSRRSEEPVSCLADGAEAIPVELATRARQVMRGQWRSGQAPTGRPVHLLSSRVRCHGCGGAAGARGSGYGCYRTMAGGDCPDPAFVRRDLLETYVVERFLSRVGAIDPSDTEDPDLPLLHAVVVRWRALTHPTETEELRAATAAVRAAESRLEQLAQDRADGLYSGGMGRHFARHVAEAESALSLAQEREKALSGDTGVDLGLFGAVPIEDAWTEASPEMRRDLIGLAVDSVAIRRGIRGQPFDGDARCEIRWAA